MKGVLLMLCLIAWMVCVSACAGAEFTVAPAPEAADVVGVDLPSVPVTVTEAPSCAAGVCAVRMRSPGLVRGQPVRNVGRVIAAPVRAVLKAKPLRRAAAAIVRARPIRRLAGLIVRAKPIRRVLGCGRR